MNINFRLVLSLLGYFIAFTGVLMLIPAVIELITGNKAAATFFIFSIITSFIGFVFAFANQQEQKARVSTKDGLLLTVLSWISVVGFAALPFKFSYLNMSYVDAYFEMMSGITTTGATTIIDLNKLSYGFHFWRAFIQWIGGIGIIVTGVILIPSMQGSGMQIFKMEAFETFDSAFDKAKRIAMGMLGVYFVFTIIVLFSLIYFANIGFFDSLIHSLTSVSTAGFSNKNESIAYFNNPMMEFVLIIAMISGGLPYILLYYMFFLRKNILWKDSQVQMYLKLLLGFGLLMALWLSLDNGIHILTALRYAIFSVTSLMTGTGYVSVDYQFLGLFPTIILFTVMFIGGCGGSTACGIKVYRFQIGFTTAKMVMEKMFLKKHVVVSYYNGKAINVDTAFAIFAYFFLFFITLLAGTIIMSILGLDFVTALSATVSTLTNVGPGLGDMVGPTGNFANIGDTGKWVLSAIMLIGRLEILGVFLVFTRHFWQN